MQILFFKRKILFIIQAAAWSESGRSSVYVNHFHSKAISTAKLREAAEQHSILKLSPTFDTYTDIYMPSNPSLTLIKGIGTAVSRLKLRSPIVVALVWASETF